MSTAFSPSTQLCATQSDSGLTQLAQRDRIYIAHMYYIEVAYPEEIDEISNSNRLC